MLEIPKHPKVRGEWVELEFMARAASCGLKVCKPWGDTARYDVTIEHAMGFHRVQVKSTIHCRQRLWMCAMPKRAYKANEFDYLAVYVIPRNVWYIIPSAEICACRPVQLLDPPLGRGKYHQYVEAWHLLRGKPSRASRVKNVADSAQTKQAKVVRS